MNTNFIKEYMSLIFQQIQNIDNGQIDMTKVLTIEQFEKIKEINYQIATKRTSNRVDTSFFVQMAERKPVILLATQMPKYTLPRHSSGQFCGVQLDNNPWIPVISLFLQANYRTYNEMTKDKPVPNVYPIIYAPIYQTDQFETFGRNKSFEASNDAYWGTNWIPQTRQRGFAATILDNAYRLFGDIILFVNNNGVLEKRSLKELWMFKGTYTRKSYPDAFIDHNKFTSQLVKDYGKYSFRESKINQVRRKLITEKKQRLLNK